MSETIEELILENIAFNESFSRKVLPFLKKEYFTDGAERTVFCLAQEYIEKYNSVPTKESLLIELSSKGNLSTQAFDSAKKVLAGIGNNDSSVSEDWLIEKAEAFCQDKAIYNAIMDSIQIMDGDKKELSRGAIPKLLADALGVSFDNAIGHDYLLDADSRFEFYHRKEERIPSDLNMLNKITKGGFPRKTLNVILAGCVHPDTMVDAKYRRGSDSVSVDGFGSIPISKIKQMIVSGYDVTVNSPDGFVRVLEFIDKGFWEEYILILDDGRTVRCNENHMFETSTGWMTAAEIHLFGVEINILTSEKFVLGWVVKTGSMIRVVDLVVDHPNHRYYTNGVSSHNTNVGKTLAMCHLAANNLSSGKNVLYITMEMAEERISERIDANLLDIAIDELHELPREVYDRKVAKVREKTTGKLIVKEFPTAGAGAAHFRHLLNELRLKKNFIPDIIYIDYINICCSTRIKLGGSVNSYSLIKSIAEELRGLAIEFNVPIISSTQTNRSGQSDTDVELEQVSESHGLSATVDFMIAIVSSEQLESMNQLMVKQLKSRYGDKTINKRFVIGVDRSKMRLYDVDESQQTLIDEKVAPKKGNGAPTFDNSAFGKRDGGKRKSFEGFTV